ncbi:restriction endonuclease subunit S [Butyricicoccus pullicaecorum]|uniref:Type I restriction modification DNA specificity domain-containing protein n=1 Tax=Butyricicoccus pullicaecorum 1.2 TaxID=1203606 RepID=R8W6B9_9FIRM|nr:restriction endonuclease subunit S [Butyricicoccus pullicaecorum]EOQ40096.1 hypothetical protein HMPREF1526_00794 [Butyricicoccus pullicaecorum 1.2]SKA65222.1 type I restriction enzyme, S subunit [Butyricicoccus pullicaecorum DSM 23266]
MARGRKKENLTPEELLQAALVPESEQPYKIPENWCWIHLGKLYQINPKNLAEDFVDAAFIPMEKIAPGFVNEYSFDVQPWCKAKKGHTQFADGDVAFAKISPCFENRKSMLLNNLPNGIGGGTTELVILRQSHMNQKYTFWFISQEQFIRGGIATYSGTVGQQRISMDHVRTYPIPVPPLLEQQRIVDRIESLFAKLDEAKQKAQDALDSFETRKAAILHKAFTGELTAQWRKEHGVGMESWKHLTYSELGISKLGKMLDKAKNKGDMVPYLRNVNVRWFSFDMGDVSLMQATEEEIKLLSVKNGDLFICEGGEPGRCAIWKGPDARLIFQKALHRFRPNEKVISEFLCYNLYFMSINGTLAKYFTGTTIKHLTGQALSRIPILTPSVYEQTEIVRILNNLLTKEQQAKEAAEKVLEQIDLIKKSILARAFRGELGTNDPSEESAVELLRQVLSASDR